MADELRSLDTIHRLQVRVREGQFSAADAGETIFRHSFQSAEVTSRELLSDYVGGIPIAG